MTVVKVADPIVTGGTEVGDILTTDGGQWTSDDPLSLVYAWEQCDAVGASCVVVPGAEEQTYALTAADIGFTLRSLVTADETAGPPPTADLYGVPISGYGLANLEIGGKPSGTINREVGYRFTAKYTASGSHSMRVYLKSDGASGSYSHGTGGQIRGKVYAVDGSGHPTGSALATTNTVTSPMSSQFHTFTFSCSFTAGTTYCIVFSNIDGDQKNNYVSLNSVDHPTSTSPRQPYATNAEEGVFFRDNGGSWGDHATRSPIMTLFYSSGQKQGQGYIDFRFSSGAFSIGPGGAKARMKITPAVTVSADTVHVWVKKSVTGAALTVQVKQGSTVIATASIPSASVGTGYGWVSAALSATANLVAGTTYTIELSTTSGTYTVYPYQDGNGAGFSGGLIFGDGYYELATNGTNWATYLSSTAFDIPIYLT